MIDSHYRALDKERAELEAMEEQKKLTYRMQNRELEIREELSRTSAGHLDIPPMPMDTPEYDMPYDEELERTIEDPDY
ncbi:hypothetical protein [Aeromonas sp. FDAARGOS 1402]|uniref:hypothetical protein n=1 Tax=Aeromonas sp. FDAARGOS 1402 TaxID=2778051 RepID=UPI001C218033|nr:hypothetical protein [Aeromonas sp. FDAARGOS 1402]QWZ56480.1 hypothetical protein I6L32_21505 [Aeromonas sp. FDAARGOS 1402]QWZ56597.1 hypothetical protein I6L32_22155 [Aeromonas sp. FDAARGOS 1402]